MKKNDFFFVALDKDEVLGGVDVDDTDVMTYDSKRYTDFRYFYSSAGRHAKNGSYLYVALCAR